MKTISNFTVLMALALCCSSMSSSHAADETKKKESAKKETTRKKSPESKKPSIEWTELTSKSGDLAKPEVKKGKKAEPPRIEFEVTGAGIKISWETKAIEKKRGSIKMVLLKEQKRGEKSSWRRAGNIGTARGASKGVKAVGIAPGRYAIELDGVDINYTITVEQAQRPS